jgi:hypothetical protein
MELKSPIHSQDASNLSPIAAAWLSETAEKSTKLIEVEISLLLFYFI